MDTIVKSIATAALAATIAWPMLFWRHGAVHTYDAGSDQQSRAAIAMPFVAAFETINDEFSQFFVAR